MKPTPLTLIILIAVSGLLFWGTLLGTAFIIVVPNIPLPAKLFAKKEAPIKKEKSLEEIKEEPVTSTNASLEGLTGVAEQFDLWRKELDAREKHLLQMDEDLIKRQALMDAEKETLQKERDKVLEIQTNVEKQLLLVEENEEKRFEEMSQLFSKMTPIEAVNYIRPLPEPQITRLITYIPKKQLIKILETWSQAFPNERDKVSKMITQTRLVVTPKTAGNP